MTMRYKSNLKNVILDLKKDIFDILTVIGSTISKEILIKSQKRIYGHGLPPDRRYIRTHTLAKNIGYVVKQGKGVATVFSNVKYAHYLEQLVGKRWQTHLVDTDLTVNIEKVKGPSGNRPYANFIPGFLAGMKNVKKLIGGITWRM